MKNKQQPIILWMVTLTLTSGEKHEFVVKALTQIEALKKAKELCYLAEVPKLRKNKLVLRD